MITGVSRADAVPHGAVGCGGRRFEAHDRGGHVHLGRILERTRRNRVQAWSQWPQHLQPVVQLRFGRVARQQVEGLAPHGPLGEVRGIVDHRRQFVGRPTLVHEADQIGRDPGDIQSRAQGFGQRHRLAADGDFHGAVQAGALQELDHHVGPVVRPYAERVARSVLKGALWQMDTDVPHVLVRPGAAECHVAGDGGA
jgi:hypothetical protein